MALLEGLIDEYRLVVCPVVLGSGRPLFSGSAASIDMKLVNAKIWGPRCRVTEVHSGQLTNPTSMPIKSKAQRRKFAELLVKGEISPETYEEWNRGAGSAELPERLHPKLVVKPKRKVKSKRAQESTTARAKKGSQPARKRS